MSLYSITLLSSFPNGSPTGFGAAIALSASGKKAVIGAPFPSSIGPFAYYSTRANGTWGTLHQIPAIPGTAQDGFGTAIAMSSDGSIILIGEPNYSSSNSFSDGAFTSVISGNPSLRFFASDPQPGSLFGNAIATSYDGATAIISAPGCTIGSNSDQGAAYVFVYSGATWTQQAKLIDSMGVANDAFGTSVSISADGNTAVIGVPQAFSSQGKASVFTRSGTSWAQLLNITAFDGMAGDSFGTYVAISADASTILAGSPNAQVGTNTGQGKAYVFVNFDGTWPFQSLLTINGNFPFSNFGTSVSLSCNGNITLVGAPGFSDNGNGPGAAFFFTRSGVKWNSTSDAIMNGGTATYDNFGSVVALSADGTIALVGDPQSAVDGSQNGSVNIYLCGYDIPSLPCSSVFQGPAGPMGGVGSQGPMGFPGPAGTNLSAGAYLNQIILFCLLLYGSLVLLFFAITFF